MEAVVGDDGGLRGDDLPVRSLSPQHRWSPHPPPITLRVSKLQIVFFYFFFSPFFFPLFLVQATC